MRFSGADGAEDARPRRVLVKKRWWLLLFGAVLLGGAALAWTTISGRAEPPIYSRQSAERAFAVAHEANAERWVPDLWAAAEAALHVSRTEQRRQELRLLPLRDFTLAREAYRLAEHKAEMSEAEARRARISAEAAAADAIEQAGRTLEWAEEAGELLPRESGVRALLARARVRWETARLHARDSDHSAAIEQAGIAAGEAQRAAEKAAAVVGRYGDARQVQTWKSWIDQTVTWSRKHQAPAIVINKERKALTLYDSGKMIRRYRADLGPNRVGFKLRAGDGATPEGKYRIVSKKGRGETRYHRALLLDYPNEQDRERFNRARRSGTLGPGARPGGLIEIHGQGGRGEDWTRGCIALSDREMDELFAHAAVGTPVTIVGGEGDGEYTALVRRLSGSGVGAGQ